MDNVSSELAEFLWSTWSLAHLMVWTRGQTKQTSKLYSSKAEVYHATSRLYTTMTIFEYF